MFNVKINSPISPLNLNYMRNTVRLTNEPDYSLACLGVALFKPRFENYSGINGYVYTGPEDEIIEAVKAFESNHRNKPAEWLLEHPTLVIGYQMSTFDAGKITQTMQEMGYKDLPQVEAYVKSELQMSDFKAFCNEKNNKAFVVLPRTSNNMAVYHFILAFLYVYFPAMFKAKPIQPDEVNILKSLTNKTSEKFIELMKKKLEPMQMELLRAELSACFAGFRENRIAAAKNEVDMLRRNVESALQTYRDYTERMNQAIITYEGMKVVNGPDQSQAEDEAIEYISTCKCLHSVTYYSGTLRYDVDTILTNFDPMKWKNAVARNDIYNGYRLDQNNPFTNLANRQLLLRALFASAEPELAVRMRAHFELEILTNTMSVPRGYAFDESIPELRDALTNPHYHFHGCPGTNRDQIMQCLRQNDIVSAIECSIAAAGSVNIAETDLTFRPFIQMILTSENKIIRRKDGVNLTPAEALLWLLKKEEEGNAA